MLIFTLWQLDGRVTEDFSILVYIFDIRYMIFGIHMIYRISPILVFNFEILMTVLQRTLASQPFSGDFSLFSLSK